MSSPGSLRAPRGMPDVHGTPLDRLRRFETRGMETLARHGFEEIRIPFVESLGLFARAAGETSDVVEKQMFRVPAADEAEEGYALRPEGTAGVVRACIEHNLLKQRSFLRLSYCGAMFRYERPQAARQRQFHQLGAEMLGSGAPSVDAACIAAASDALRAAGLSRWNLRLNTIGCRACRPAVRGAIIDAVAASRDRLCETCLRRLDRNPLRVLDCGRPGCREVAKGLPKPVDLVCTDCRSHHDGLRALLGELGEPFSDDPLLVRGLDYYTRTLFEYQVPELGARDAVGGGGRYDDLVEELGGPSTPAIGFSLGAEATLLAVEKTGGDGAGLPWAAVDVFIAVAGDGRTAALRLAAEVRALGRGCDLDLEGRSLRSQMKAADRSGASVCLLLGDEEEARGVVRWKPLRGGGAEEELPRAEVLARLAGGVRS